MNIAVKNNRTFITNVPYECRSSLLSIPAVSYQKKARAFVGPASPITMARLANLHHTHVLKIDSVDDRCRELMQEWHDIESRSRFKGEKAALDARKISHDNWLTQTVPWAHQAAAALFCEDLTAAYLAMEMGTGKTLVVINEILREIEKGHGAFLIICPKSVIDVWGAEFKKHAPHLEVHVEKLKGGTSTQKAEQVLRTVCYRWFEKPCVIVTNYESVWRGDLGEIILSTRWRMVVADEAHKIKSPSGKASKFCAKLGPLAAMRRCLSGTPIPNNQLDAFGQWRFLDPGYFGTNIARMRARYCTMGGFGGYEIVGWKNQREFERLFDYLSYRVDKSVLDLPPAVDTRRYCSLPAKAQKLYAQCEDELVAEINENQTVVITNVLKKIAKLQQVSSGFIIDDDGETIEIHQEKSKLLQEFIESIDEDEQVVVFCKFVRDLGEVRRVCDETGRSYGELSGRANDIRDGRLPPDIDVLGAQIQAGGIGVDFTAARYCVMYSVGYNLADYLQAKARVHRGGQDRPVTYIHLVADQPIEEQVYDSLMAKEEVADRLLSFVKRGERG